MARRPLTLLGDVNDDGTISIADAAGVINMILL
ncbi:MAG: hypothetical protein K6A96_14060 [Prevotella sp.]|nr:hypothetical protein [Prevotella sp.]